MHPELQLIVDQTRKMFKLAEAGDWEKLAEVDRLRSHDLDAFFATDQLRFEPDAAQIIKNIQVQDKNILRMVLSAKDGLRIEMAQAGNNKRAVKAYLGT